jgi:hypothetical protein
MLTAPPNAKVIELPTSTIWLDDEGILRSISKKAPKQTLEQTRNSLEILKKYINNQKVCMLLDVTNSSEAPREVRDFAAQALPEIAKAIAMISQSALGKMLANLFFSLKSHPYPVKIFNNENEALQWLRQYL